MATRSKSKAPSRSTSTRSSAAPCVFRGAFIKEQVDPRIKEEWEESRTGRPPWGDWRKQWKQEHCRRVSGSGDPIDCPYTEEQCGTAFLQAARIAMDGEKPGALFRAVAAVSGMRRADDKPLARELDRAPREGDPPRRTLHLDPPGAAAVQLRGVVSATDAHLLGRRAAPVHISSLLRSDDAGPREGPDAGGGPGEAPERTTEEGSRR